MLTRFGDHYNNLPNTGKESKRLIASLLRLIAHIASKQPIQFPFVLPATAPKRQPTPTVQKETTAAFAFGEPALFFRSNAAHGLLAFTVHQISEESIKPFNSKA